jgi:hypothetical protein
MTQPLDPTKIIELYMSQISQQKHLTRQRTIMILDAETHKERLGPFYKQGVTFAQRYVGIDILLEAFLTDVEEKHWTDVTAQKRPPKRVYLGVSGAGKTYSLLRTCRKTYTLYNTASLIFQEEDRYTQRLIDEIRKLSKVSFETPADRNTAGLCAIIRWITVKWMCLLHLLDCYKDYTPDEFLYSQLNDQSTYYKTCYDACQSLTFGDQDYQQQLEIWESIHRIVIETISEKTGIYTGFGFAFDEAQVLYELFTDLYVRLYCTNS